MNVFIIGTPYETAQALDERRLYTKDPEHYAQWAELGLSYVNWYWSPSEDTYIYYRNGKRVTMNRNG